MNDDRTIQGNRQVNRARRFGGAVLLGILAVTTGCAAAVGAALAATEIRQGIAGLQQLVAGTRSVPFPELEVTRELSSPLAGTYRGYQVLGDDTVRFYVRTAEHPTAPIVDEGGNVSGYVLPGLAAASLDTLESRIPSWTSGRNSDVAGRAMFFIEGTQSPEPNARSLYPAAFLGRLPEGESAGADRQYAELLRLELDMEAPDFRELTGQGIPQELFDTVADAVFTLRPDGSAVYHQEYDLEDGRTLILHWERISATALPDVRSLPR